PGCRPAAAPAAGRGAGGRGGGGGAEGVVLRRLLGAAPAWAGAASARFGLVGGCFLVGILLLWAGSILFFRDPRRIIPKDPKALLSPADGTVTDVGEVEDPDFPGGRAFRISIFLSIFDVHINRVPRTGRIVALRYLPGEFLDARLPRCIGCNEQMWIDLEEANPPRLLRIKQIAGAVARRIVCELRPEQRVEAGERFGMIKFGSRTEVLLPLGEPFDVAVQPGVKVKAGSSVLLRFVR
ncbi:MAG: phosphatidylserine decarboxylase, partial [Gemmataceae bacterium]|nr:phosphatidylserine decarboxylase [Gemmataceae bacterium]MDW8266424.1 phosphatidylserine decarboxylase [Gemmataceae bacterium]